jgi:tetratricopeptide (TPR) repeat protein
MLGHALDHHAWADADRIVRPLDAYWDAQGLGEEAAAWADRILAAIADPGHATHEGARSLQAYSISHQGQRLRNAGQPDRAARAYRQLLAWLQEQPETEQVRQGIAAAYHQLGVTSQDQGRLDEAEDWYRKSLAVEEGLGNRPGMAGSYHQLGTIAEDRGRLDEAEDWYRKSLAIKEGLDNRPGMAGSYFQLGIIAHRRRRLDEAEDWYYKSLAIEVGFGDRPGIAVIYQQLGMIAEDRRRLDEAEDWYRKSLIIREGLRDRPGMAGSYHQLGNTAYRRGRLDEAEDWYRQSFAIREELGDRPGMALTYGQLSLLAEARQQLHQALDWIVRSVTLFDQFPHPATGLGPQLLARFTRQLGISVLEEAWQQATGQPVPQPVRDFITSHHDQTPPGGQS